MKVLVLGSSGMAGHVISTYFLEKGHNVLGFDKKDGTHCNTVVESAVNTDKIKELIQINKFDAIINCVGILNQFAEQNKALAIFLNSYLPHFLVQETKDLKTKVIHMSTDCVFSGKRGNYTEDDFKDGNTIYDRTKALGEINNKKDLTFRNSIIGPDMNENGIGLFNWFMKQKGEIRGYEKAIWTGVTTITLARAMGKALEQNLTGLYNLVNNDKISKYEILILFNECIGKSNLKIISDDKVKIDKSLINNRTDFQFEVPGYKEMICEMKEWIDEHKNFYPHYFKQ